MDVIAYVRDYDPGFHELIIVILAGVLIIDVAWSWFRRNR